MEKKARFLYLHTRQCTLIIAISICSEAAALPLVVQLSQTQPAAEREGRTEKASDGLITVSDQLSASKQEGKKCAKTGTK